MVISGLAVGRSSVGLGVGSGLAGDWSFCLGGETPLPGARKGAPLASPIEGEDKARGSRLHSGCAGGQAWFGMGQANPSVRGGGDGT